jgi:L-methionine (R)-S-oxide reductase
VCAGAYIHRITQLVADVEAYPGHIACDGETKSEIVVPLVIKSSGIPIGVLDLDCLALEGFNEEDQKGLERIAELIVDACDW